MSSYFERMESLITNFHNTVSHSIEMKYYSSSNGLVKGFIIFTNGYKLEFMEVKNGEISSKINFDVEK